MAGFEKTTGWQFASGISITQIENGTSQTYTISMLPEFEFNAVQYPTLSADDFSLLDQPTYEARRDAFISYLLTQYTGITISANGSIIEAPDYPDGHYITQP